MNLLKMRPEQVQEAVRSHVPVLIPAGVVEYHGPHLPVGTDFLIANAICEAVEKRVTCVLMPPLPFGPTLSWAAGSSEGEMDFEPEAFFGYVREMFRHIIRMGFRRVYVLQHHQGPEGLQVLCLKRAAMEVVRELTATWGAEWGRADPAALPVPGIFQMIQIAALDTYSHYPDAGMGLKSERVPVGHAGKGETQLIWGAYPETLRLEALESLPVLPEWLKDATEATEAEGKRWLEFCIQGWVQELART
jgi:creatinine amidohydrolase